MSGVLARYYDASREFAYFGILGVVAVVAGVVVFVICAVDQPADGRRALSAIVATSVSVPSSVGCSKTTSALRPRAFSEAIVLPNSGPLRLRHDTGSSRRALPARPAPGDPGRRVPTNPV